MGIVDKISSALGSDSKRDEYNTTHTSTTGNSGPAALADGKPASTTVDDRIGGTHTREVKDAVTHEQVGRHAHHEVTPVVDRTRDETHIHQKVQPVVDEQRRETHHEHQAPAVHRERGEDISREAADKFRAQGHHEHTRQVGEQTHSTQVHAPKVHEHVNKHIVEQIQPVIERQTYETEHHHTVQPITEHHTHAPKIHDTVTNAPISMSEFTGGSSGTGAATGHHGSTTGTTGREL